MQKQTKSNLPSLLEIEFPLAEAWAVLSRVDDVGDSQRISDWKWKGIHEEKSASGEVFLWASVFPLLRLWWLLLMMGSWLMRLQQWASWRLPFEWEDVVEEEEEFLGISLRDVPEEKND